MRASGIAAVHLRSKPQPPPHPDRTPPTSATRACHPPTALGCHRAGRSAPPQPGPPLLVSPVARRFRPAAGPVDLPAGTRTKRLSSNGTFVLPEEDASGAQPAEIRLREEELILTGRGWLGLGRSATTHGEHSVRFTVQAESV
mgnify:CR=1 FL=1